MWGSSQNPKGAMRPCPSAYEKHKVLEKKQKHSVPLDTLNTRIGHRCLQGLLGCSWCQIVCSFPYWVRAQLWQSHYMHTSSPPFWGRGGEVLSFLNHIAMIKSMIRSPVHLLCHRQSSTWFQQDSHLLTLLPRLHWMSWAFTSRCHYHATKTHLWQVTVQPSFFLETTFFEKKTENKIILDITLYKPKENRAWFLLPRKYFRSGKLCILVNKSGQLWGDVKMT